MAHTPLMVMNRQPNDEPRAVIVKNYQEGGCGTRRETCRNNLCSANRNAETIKFVPPADMVQKEKQRERAREERKCKEIEREENEKASNFKREGGRGTRTYNYTEENACFI